MALGNWDNVTRPNQKLGAGDELELIIEEYGGMVEGTIERVSKLKPFIPVRSVRGTSTITNFAVGETELGTVTPGTAPEAGEVQFSETSLTIDTLVYGRNTVPLLDTFQTVYDARQEVATEHGKKIAKFTDQAFFIQAIKAARLSGSAFGALPGHNGGNVQNIATADVTDPAALYAALADLMVQFENKDVDPIADGLIIVVRPAQYYTLLQNDVLIDADYITSDGNTIKTKQLSTWGVPVISSNNLPNTNITGHLLSNTRNSNAYDGDFTNVVAAALSPRALLAGETIPLTSDVFYDKVYKLWFIDSHLSFGVTPHRAEYAGVIQST